MGLSPYRIPQAPPPIRGNESIVERVIVAVIACTAIWVLFGLFEPPSGSFEFGGDRTSAFHQNRGRPPRREGARCSQVSYPSSDACSRRAAASKPPWRSGQTLR
jgi:hypothetical protein